MTMDALPNQVLLEIASHLEAREICRLSVASKYFDDSDLGAWSDLLERDWWMCTDEITRQRCSKVAKRFYLDLHNGRQSFRAMAFADRGDACSALSCRHVLARYSAREDCFVCQLMPVVYRIHRG